MSGSVDVGRGYEDSSWGECFVFLLYFFGFFEFVFKSVD